MTLWIYSYPRSGNSLVAAMLLGKGDRRYEQRCHPSEPDGIDRAIAAGLLSTAQDGELIAKTHFYGDLELVQGDVVYIPYRDGRDALTSFWQYDAPDQHPIAFWEGLGARGFRWDQWMQAARTQFPRATAEWVRYERAVYEQWGLDWKALHELAPRYFQSGRVGRWRELPLDAREYLQRELGPELERWGYPQG